CGRPCNHRRHDGIACDWVVDHLDGRGRADHLWRIAGACRLSDCIREQPLDYLFYLALRTVMRSGLPVLAGTAKGVTSCLSRANSLSCALTMAQSRWRWRVFRPRPEPTSDGTLCPPPSTIH